MALPVESFGLGEPLHSPPDAKFDIVFVHGLGGHRVNTWTNKATEEAPFERFWPKDFLKTACPKARILSFGYDANFAHFYPLYGPKTVPVGTTIDDHSTSLLLSLSNMRSNTGTPPERPLIFVAHSLGGLVVANALSQPAGANEADVKLTEATAGCIFLGTPFEGSSKARWATQALKFVASFSSTNKESVNELQERSQKLAAVNDNFYKLIKVRDQAQRPIGIACFYETWDTYVAKKKVGVVVSRESATLSGVSPVPIAATHSGMCKFADEARDGYKAVSGILSKWIKELDVQSGPKNKAGIVHSGDQIFSGAVHNRGVIARDIDGQTKDAVKVTGSVNYYGSDFKPDSQD